MQKYCVHQHSTETILTWIRSGEIAIPEIQRPYVWNSTKVRYLMDSLYYGYPIGYSIIWRNPDVRLKNGKTADGKKILIDVQQRVIALKAAILGEAVDSYLQKKSWGVNILPQPALKRKSCRQLSLYLFEEQINKLRYGILSNESSCH